MEIGSLPKVGWVTARGRRGAAALLAVALAAAPLAPARAGEPSADLQARMSGRFELAEPKAAVEERLAQTIEQTISPMNFLIRPIARSRLGRVVVYCGQYDLGLDAQKVRVKCDERAPIERKLDNSEGRLAGLDEQPVQVDVKVESDAVALTFGAEEGMRTTTYRFDADGGMEVQVSVVSSQLGKPIEWAIRYRRAGGAPRTSPAQP
jgi:hypothetical protein